MNGIELAASRRPFLIVCLIALAACGVAVMVVFGDARGRLESRPAEAHQGATPAAGPGAGGCSAWQFTWEVRPETRRADDGTILANTHNIVQDRLDLLVDYSYYYVQDGSILDLTPATTETPIIIVELLFVEEADTLTRLDAYERILSMPGVVAIVADPSELGLTTPGVTIPANLYATPDDAATPGTTPVVTGPKYPVLFDNNDIYFAYPDFDARTGDYTVTIQLAEDASPTLEAYLDDRPSRPVAVLLDQEVIAVSTVDAVSLEAGYIVLPAEDEDQANAWSIVLESGQHDALLVPVTQQPVNHYLCG